MYNEQNSGFRKKYISHLIFVEGISEDVELVGEVWKRCC